jgi:hypothetical protein
MNRRAPCLRPLRYALPLAAALVLAACTMASQTPGPATGASDPTLQGHARWCGMTPPSGYCDVDDHR